MHASGWSIYFTRPMLMQFLLGTPSGLPLSLTAGILTAWLFEAGIDKTSIGIFAAVALPYSLKFIWAPLMDGVHIPTLGRRRGWMLLTQLAMALFMGLMAMHSPADAPFIIGLLAFLLAFASASHDIVKDAYRVEALPPEQQGAGSASFVLGYRVGNNLIAAVGALYLAEYYGWQASYAILAGVMLLLAIPLVWVAEPTTSKKHDAAPHGTIGISAWLIQFVVQPFVEFLRRKDALLVLAFVLLYRMADAFLGIMAYPFYLDIGFSKVDIANVSKLYGLIAMSVGALVGGMLVYRLGISCALWVGGIAASISNLMFVWQAQMGAEIIALIATITLDNISGGFATTALIAYMGSLINLRFSATQFALLSSLSALGRTWLTVPAGLAAEQLGWSGFFVLSTLLGIPALLVLWKLPTPAKT